jgi:hypothetical protein
VPLVSMPWRVLPFCLLLLLGACAGMGAVNPQQREGIRTIGIISALPEMFHVQKIGLVAFLNDLKEFPIGTWGIDDYVTAKVRTLLGKRYDVRPAIYQRDAIAAASEAWGGLGEKVRPYISTQGLDAYLVIRGGRSGYANTNQVLDGFGILDVWDLQYFAFAPYQITLLDGHDFSRLGQSAGVLPAAESPAYRPIAGPHMKVDQSWWPTSLDAGSNPRLKTAVINLIDQSLPDTLKRIQLID